MATRTQRLSRAIVRAPGASFVAGLTRANLGRPDYQLALSQHAAYCRALENCGLTLTRLGPDERFPDSTFVEDTAVIIPRRNGIGDSKKRAAVVTRPGAVSRRGEELTIKQTLTQLGLEIFEIAPRKVKQAVVGYGAAQKSAVAKMVQRVLRLPVQPDADAADALALAMAYAQTTSRYSFDPPKRV